jgi:hypothetical protein
VIICRLQGKLYVQDPRIKGVDQERMIKYQLRRVLKVFVFVIQILEIMEYWIIIISKIILSSSINLILNYRTQEHFQEMEEDLLLIEAKIIQIIAKALLLLKKVFRLQKISKILFIFQQEKNNKIFNLLMGIASFPQTQLLLPKS